MINKNIGELTGTLGSGGKRKRKKKPPIGRIDPKPKKPPVGRIDPAPKKPITGTPITRKPPSGRIDPSPKKPMPTDPIIKNPIGRIEPPKRRPITTLTGALGVQNDDLMKSARRVGDELTKRAEEMKRKNAGGGLTRRLPTIPKYGR